MNKKKVIRRVKEMKLECAKMACIEEKVITDFTLEIDSRTASLLKGKGVLAELLEEEDLKLKVVGDGNKTISTMRITAHVEKWGGGF
jgi:hypothetical protein